MKWIKWSFRHKESDEESRYRQLKHCTSWWGRRLCMIPFLLCPDFFSFFSVCSVVLLNLQKRAALRGQRTDTLTETKNQSIIINSWNKIQRQNGCYLILFEHAKSKSFLTSKICIYFIMHYAYACSEVQFVSDDILCFSQLPDASKRKKKPELLPYDSVW